MVIGSELFTWDASRRVFSTEASDLDANGYAGFQRGFTMRSARTMQEIRFVPLGAVRDRDGDVVAHEFATPALAGVKAMVFND